MKHILTIKLSKRAKLSYFQNFISFTFLDNLSLEKNLVDSLYFYAPLIRLHVFFFYKDVCCEGKLSRTSFRGMASFLSLYFVTQYFVNVSSDPLKSLLTNKFRNCSI